MAEKKTSKKDEELKSDRIRRENEEAEKEQREYAMYDLDVTAEERGYEVEGPKLAPENELLVAPKASDDNVEDTDEKKESATAKRQRAKKGEDDSE